MMLARRSFLTGLFSALAAPAIVRAGSLMPVRALPIDLIPLTPEELLHQRMNACYAQMRAVMDKCLYTVSYGDQRYQLRHDGLVTLLSDDA